MNEAITAGKVAVNEIRNHSANIIAAGAMFLTALEVGKWPQVDKNFRSIEEVKSFNTLQSIYKTHYGGNETVFFKMAPKEHKHASGRHEGAKAHLSKIVSQHPRSTASHMARLQIKRLDEGRS